MSIISIIGTTGVGKSFLVKQLSSITQCPAFFEGEEGTIPEKIFKNVFKNSNPEERYIYLIERYKKNFLKAKKISEKLNIDCFIEDSYLSPIANIEYEKEKYKDRLLQISNKIKNLEPDKTLLLVAEKNKITELIKERGRTSEMNPGAIKRSLAIQKYFIDLAKSEKNIKIIDRTNLNFSHHKDIQNVLKKIKK